MPNKFFDTSSQERRLALHDHAVETQVQQLQNRRGAVPEKSKTLNQRQIKTKRTFDGVEVRASKCIVRRSPLTATGIASRALGVRAPSPLLVLQVLASHVAVAPTPLVSFKKKKTQSTKKNHQPNSTHQIILPFHLRNEFA